MKSKTVAVSIAAPPDKVYAFASNPENLPRWAPSFVKKTEKRGGEWIVPSPDGPVIIAFVENNRLGVLDHTVRLPSGVELYNPMRVFANGAGSEVTFTLFQTKGMFDEKFIDNAALLKADLDLLKRAVESSHE